jgi:2-methylisocitrate lyase-like PEP mutase family enzyme
MSNPKMTKRLRELIAAGETVVKPGVYDVLSARIVEQAGFKALGVSGYSVSASLLGKPDAGLITLPEIVGVTRNIANVVKIPVIADADTGFGNAINVMRTTEEFIRAGAAAIHMEDQVMPKRCGHVAGKELISTEEMVGKIRAACRVRDELDSNFVIIARTDARGAVNGSVEAVIERAKAYVDAGADMIFPEAPTNEAEVERFVREIPGPIHYNRTGLSPLLSYQRCQDLGIEMVSNAGGAMRAAAAAVWDYMHEFKARDAEYVAETREQIVGHALEDFHGFIGFNEIRDLENAYLPADQVLRKYNGTLGYGNSGGKNNI